MQENGSFAMKVNDKTIMVKPCNDVTSLRKPAAGLIDELKRAFD